MISKPLALAGCLQFLAAQAGTPPFFVRAGALMCDGTGSLVQPLTPQQRAAGCFGTIPWGGKEKPLGVVVMDIDDVHPEFVFVCRVAPAWAAKAVLDYQVKCGYALTSTIVDAGLNQAPIDVLKKAAHTSTAADVRKMGQAPDGCMVNDSAKWC